MTLHASRTTRFPRVRPLGDGGFTVEFGDTIDPEVNDRVLAFAAALDAMGLPGVTEVVPSYCAVAVYADPGVDEMDELADRLVALAATPNPGPTSFPRHVEIPVVYGDEYGPDLEEVAAFSGLPQERVILLHASVEYRAFMLGFSPGFPYLGPVPEAIAMPRRAEPRTRVAAGSVGLAASQTGIYPIESPGGWRIIGRTPLDLYDASRPDPFLIRPGDRVRFRPIARNEYERLARQSVH